MKKIVTLGELKVGSYVLIDGEPCKVVKVERSKPGKHGVAKVRIEGIGIFDKTRHTIVGSASQRVEAPIIERRKAQVLSVSEDIATCMDLESFETIEAIIPEELREKVKEGLEVIYWSIMGKNLIFQVRKEG